MINVYTILSKATSLEGIFITNKSKDLACFYRYKRRENSELKMKFIHVSNLPLVTVHDEY